MKRQNKNPLGLFKRLLSSKTKASKKNYSAEKKYKNYSRLVDNFMTKVQVD